MSAGWNAVKPIAIWTAATGLGIGVSWLGIRPVLDAAVPDRLVAVAITEPDTPSTSAPPAPQGALARVSPRPAPSRTPALPSTPAGAANSAPPVTPDGWTVLGPGRYLRSFQLAGGNATVQADHGRVELISATPQPGFVMTVTPTDDDRVVVNFTTVLHISTLEAAWADTGPVADVTEIP
jgi:hypothetical protein